MSTGFIGSGALTASLEDLILELKTSQDRTVLLRLLTGRLAEARAEEYGLVVEDEEFEQAVADFHADRDLFEPGQIEAWLRDRHLSEEDVRRSVRRALLVGKLRAAVAPDAAIEHRFRASPHDFARVTVEVITVSSAGIAAELLLQLKEGETDWLEAGARGCEARTISRREAPDEIAASLFASAPGTIIGPEETEEGRYAIYRVVSAAPASLDDQARAAIAQELFDEAVAREIGGAGIRFLR